MASLMFDSDNPIVLTDPRFAGCRVATYADLLTPSLVTVLGPRLVVIDRGLGDPLGLAHVADIESGLLTVSAGADRIRQWTAEGRQYITAYHDRADWAAVAAAVAPLQPWNWVATLDGSMNPDGRYPAVVQFASEAKVGIHVDVSLVWNDTWRPLPAGLDPGTVTRLETLVGQAMTAGQNVLDLLKGL